MLIVETIRKIRLSVHRDGKSLRKTAEDLNLSRNTVRKVIRSEETSFTYKLYSVRAFETQSRILLMDTPVLT